MANGFFLGGAAEGIESAQKQALAERTLTEDTALRGRGLDIQERQLQRQFGQDILTRADKQIDDTMAIVAETIKNAVTVGRSPDQIQKAVAPLVASAKAVAARIGRDPNALDARVQAQLFQPDAIEAAETSGRAKATETISEAKTLNASGFEGGIIRDPAKRAELEGKMQDDYFKQSSDFIKIRDSINRIRSVEQTGAGDMALIFNYMKILDPGSTVREGEYATAQNAAGVPSAIHAMYNRIVGGGQLADEARKQIKAQAERMYQAQALQHDKLSTQFAGIAKRRGLNVDNVVPDLSTVPSFKSMAEVEKAVTDGSLKIGDKILFNGRVVRVTP